MRSALGAVSRAPHLKKTFSNDVHFANRIMVTHKVHDLDRISFSPGQIQFYSENVFTSKYAKSHRKLFLP